MTEAFFRNFDIDAVFGQVYNVFFLYAQSASLTGLIDYLTKTYKFVVGLPHSPYIKGIYGNYRAMDIVDCPGLAKGYLNRNRPAKHYILLVKPTETFDGADKFLGRQIQE